MVVIVVDAKIQFSCKRFLTLLEATVVLIVVVVVNVNVNVNVVVIDINVLIMAVIVVADYNVVSCCQ